MSLPSPPTYMIPALQVTEVIEAALTERPQIRQVLDVFPRDMTKLVSYGFEIPVITQQDLSLQSARRYLCILSGSDRTPKTETHERRLSGLLHIGPPSNLILLDAQLSTRWANYVIAHEIGHFFGDLLLIRQQWLAHFPDQRDDILKAFAWQPHNDMLDLQALIRGLPPRPRPILARGYGELLETEAREHQADLVARELLAPWRILAALASHHTVPELESLLYQDYGLPKRVTHYYAADLHDAYDKPTSFIDRLFAPVDPQDPSST
jgi:hypothetical protein